MLRQFWFARRGRKIFRLFDASATMTSTKICYIHRRFRRKVTQRKRENSRTSSHFFDNQLTRNIPAIIIRIHKIQSKTKISPKYSSFLWIFTLEFVHFVQFLIWVPQILSTFVGFEVYWVFQARLQNFWFDSWWCGGTLDNRQILIMKSDLILPMLQRPSSGSSCEENGECCLCLAQLTY